MIKNSFDTIKPAFNDWKEQNRPINLYEDYLMEEQYKYWENQNEKEGRLLKMWIEERKRNVELPEKTKQEIEEMNADIRDSLRKIKRRVDQILIKAKKHPVFGANYNRVKQDEFMVDVDIDFYKLKKFLSRSLREIKGMEEVETDFDKLREMMKRKVIRLHGINKLRNETKMILNEEEDFEVKHELVLLKKKQIELEKKVTEEEITFDQSIDQTQFKHHGSETKDNSEKEYKDMKQKILTHFSKAVEKINLSKDK